MMNKQEGQTNCGSSPLLCGHSKLKVRRGGVMWLERLIWPPYYYVQCPHSQKYLHSDGSWGWGTCFKTRREAEAAIKIATQEST